MEMLRCPDVIATSVENAVNGLMGETRKLDERDSLRNIELMNYFLLLTPTCRNRMVRKDAKFVFEVCVYVDEAPSIFLPILFVLTLLIRPLRCFQVFASS